MAGDDTREPSLADQLRLPGGPWWSGPLDRFAHVDDTTDGFTELRVHGVSGPLPGSVLEFPEPVVTLVNGNADSGFWRRWRLGGSLQDEPGRHRIEGFCWGGLTSRAHWQALWLLVLPFSLVNVAHWMLLPREEGSRSGGMAAWVSVALLRMLALSFTVTLLLAGAEVTMDLGAWQCEPQAGCRYLPGWLTGLQPGIRVAAGGAVLSAVLLVLWVAGRARFAPLEPPAAAPSPVVERFRLAAASEKQPVLADQNFWAADMSARWLRCLHGAAWCAGAGALAADAALAHNPGGPVRVLFWADIAALGLISLAVIPQRYGRGGPGPTLRGGKPASTAPLRWIVGVGLVLLGLSLAAVAVGLQNTRTKDHPLSPDLPSSVLAAHPHLPGLWGAIGWLALGQFAALVALTGCLGLLAWQGRKAWTKGYTPMLWGFLPLVFTWLGWFLGLALTAGAGLWIAARLGKAASTPGAAPAGSGPKLVLPPIYSWIGLGVIAAVAVLLLGVAWIAGRVLHRTGQVAGEIVASNAGNYAAGGQSPSPDEVTRARSAARVQILAQSVEDVPRILGLMAAVTAVAAITAVVRYGHAGGTRGWFWPSGWLANTIPQVGSWVIVTSAVFIVGLAYGAFRSQTKRRLIGILWDITTFWPRANHPLTPACSAERAVPQLARRVTQLTRGPADTVVISAHSQGCILAAAAVLNLKNSGQRHLKQVSLLTYGSPLRRLYARSFPAYFSADVLRQVAKDLGGNWTNLWAHTDPIGADICPGASAPAGDAPASSAPAGDAPATKSPVTDLLMKPDPLILGPDPRTGLHVPVCDHSGFRARPEYRTALKDLRESWPRLP
jgi:hypothetical protein